MNLVLGKTKDDRWFVVYRIFSGGGTGGVDKGRRYETTGRYNQRTPRNLFSSGNHKIPETETTKETDLTTEVYVGVHLILLPGIFYRYEIKDLGPLYYSNWTQ